MSGRAAVHNDTIAAIASAHGEGAVALLRLSGDGVRDVLGRVFRGRCAVGEMEPRRQYLGEVWHAEKKLDEVLACFYPGPRSYTGEDVVELGCHGGVLVSRRILDALLAAGARAALPGEFTQRAFLAGKMDLTQAEAVMDLISAQSERALRAAAEQLEGRLGAKIRGLQDAVVEVLAHVEAYIDFPEEDIDPDTGVKLFARLDALESGVRELLATAGQGRLWREGVRTVIFGAPNVGKSSLLNLLLGQERAIVSARPGTTRDVIEEAVSMRGYVLRLADTAGLRETDDELELEGMERTRRQLDRADLVLEVFDASRAPDDQAGGSREVAADELEAGARGPVRVRVLNKMDLGEHPGWSGMEGVRISCVRGEGLEELEQRLIGALEVGGGVQQDWGGAINARHQACLETLLGFTQMARSGLEQGLPPEFVAEELRGALEAVGQILGRVDSDDILGKIFGTFCIGK
jgi:tRNA modification GTPase